MDERVRIRTADGFDIAAIVRDGGDKDVVIWLHGISVDKDEYLGFFHDGAECLGNHGFTSIRFDFRGHGESSGNPMDFSVVGQSLDVEAVLKFAQRVYPAKSTRLHVVGASFGAPVAIFAAMRHSKRVQTVTLLSPVLSYRRTFLEPVTAWASELFTEESLRRAEEGVPLHLDGDFFLGPRLIEEMRLIRPDLMLSDVHQPVLVFHGDRDSMVPYQVTEEICGQFSNLTLVTMDGIDHGFMIEGDEDGTDLRSVANKERIFTRMQGHMQWAVK